ncbi:hypothetical protein JL722_6028 [Aureococcus anophagefferens]|nr:hypothetical protein JL722_6028 [Aureococcus anophagefferens]
MEFARLGAPLVRQLDDVGRACVAEVEEACPGHRCYVCGDAAGGVVRACGCAKGRDAHLACLARVASRESEANGSYPRWDRCAVCGDAFAEPAVRLGVARGVAPRARRTTTGGASRRWPASPTPSATSGSTPSPPPCAASRSGSGGATFRTRSTASSAPRPNSRRPARLGRCDEALALRRKVAAGYAALLGEDDRAALDAVVALAESLGDRDRVREERGVLRDAPRARSALGAAHATTVAVVKALAGYEPPPETPVNTPVPWVPPR